MLSGLNDSKKEEDIAQRENFIIKLQEVEEEIRNMSHELSESAYHNQWTTLSNR